MLKLIVPKAVEQEFATVEKLWRSTGETRRVDALLLSWIKREKQLWRLFCFLVYQHPMLTDMTINNALYPEYTSEVSNR